MGHSDIRTTEMYVQIYGGRGHAAAVLLDNHKGTAGVVDRMTSIENASAMRLPAKNTSHRRSAYRGVYPAGRGRWQAKLSIVINGKKRNLYIGCFENDADAARAYDAVARQHGRRLNFPQDLDAATPESLTEIPLQISVKTA